jgi:hypothetical protein
MIRERVVELTERNHHLQDDPLGGRFIWQNRESPSQWTTYRVPTTKTDGRRIKEITFEELHAAALASNGSDASVEVARKFGIRRVAAMSRARLEAIGQIIAAGGMCRPAFQNPPHLNSVGTPARAQAAPDPFPPEDSHCVGIFRELWIRA